MVLDIERQLRWYRSIPNSGEDQFDWTFLVINEPREIRQILDRARQELLMVIDERAIAEGLIKKSGGLHYDLRIIRSEVYNPDFSKIYSGRVLNDRRLNSKACSDNWNSLINLVASGKI